MADKPTISTPNLDLDKNPGQTMSPKVPKMPAIPKVPPKTNQVGVSPDSKKDPTKQAEQIKDASLKQDAMEAIRLNKSGQWSLDKVDPSNMYFHIHQDGYRITDKPMHYKEIVQRHGPVKELESKGFRLHPADKPEEKVEKRAPKGVDPKKHERCVMGVKQQGHDVGSAHAICSASMNKNNSQWSLKKTDDIVREELEKIDWKGVGKKAAGLATAGALTAGAMGMGATEAKGDVGHLKHYLKSMHGMNIGGHDVHVSHEDTTNPKLKGSTSGAGNFSIKVGDYKINGSYSGVGDGSHHKLQLSGPVHVKGGHAPFEGDLDTKGDDAAESLHNYLSGNSDDKHLSLQNKLMQERTKEDGNKGLNIGSFNLEKPIQKSNNDQWSLEKKKPPFDPRAERGTYGGEMRDRWAHHHDAEAKSKIPRMEGAARTRALSKLAGSTEYRRNPHTNEVEFLMHRGINEDELKNNHSVDKGITRYHNESKNGWTPKLNVAHDFGVYGDWDNKKGHVVSAWVPESQLHTSFRQYGSDSPSEHDMLRDEDEWLVSHEQPLQHHKVVEADKLQTGPKPSKIQRMAEQQGQKVKTMKDFSPEELQAMTDRANKK